MYNLQHCTVLTTLKAPVYYMCNTENEECSNMEFKHFVPLSVEYCFILFLYLIYLLLVVTNNTSLQMTVCRGT
jgi:hypothetical protein